ncbi:uncharacterized protein PHALS_08898 [Plasmopara halstedii]|uniref:Uncharacterized protein n=1 Tax=Plasmopara halstedii TaxID=4781 RepID=A0A0P1ADR2_PLAHL|nr:uncharacterized protein PHALS_08898 [Plasmopara halstedii]CEG38848.1 hypothetical protein PHALS_08898 [Plasmopara halstedii]|eukprot:XP_024575217.1 hypothetical protein PHALS_08898 [Plasmopara halstedii]
MDALSATLTVTPTAPTTTNINFATSISPTNEPAIEGRNETFFEDTQSEDDDCGSFDIAGDADDVSQGEEEMSEMDFGSHDVAGCENCGSIDTAGTEVEQTNRFIKSSLNLNNFDASYISSKVQPYK